jgi:hypothetical protein
MSKSVLNRYGLNLPRQPKFKAENLVNMRREGECPLPYLIGTNHAKLIREMAKYYKTQYPLNMTKQNVRNLITAWNRVCECPTNSMSKLTRQQEINMWKKVINLNHKSIPLTNRNVQRIRVNLECNNMQELLRQTRNMNQLIKNFYKQYPAVVSNIAFTPVVQRSIQQRVQRNVPQRLHRYIPPRYR